MSDLMRVGIGLCIAFALIALAAWYLLGPVTVDVAEEIPVDITFAAVDWTRDVVQPSAVEERSIVVLFRSPMQRRDDDRMQRFLTDICAGFAPHVTLVVINADAHPGLLQRLDVVDLPEVHVIDDGRSIARLAGFIGPSELRTWLQRSVPSLEVPELPPLAEELENGEPEQEGL